MEQFQDNPLVFEKCTHHYSKTIVSRQIPGQCSCCWNPSLLQAPRFVRPGAKAAQSENMNQ